MGSIISVVGAEGFKAFGILYTRSFDIFDKGCENNEAAGRQDDCIDRKRSPLPCHVKDKAEENRGNRLRGHAGRVIIAGKFADRFGGRQLHHHGEGTVVHQRHAEALDGPDGKQQ